MQAPYTTVSTFYDVTINGTTFSALSSPSDGFIDPTKVQNLVTDFNNPPSGFTYLAAQTKRRANVRYQFLIEQLERLTNLYLWTVTATGADAVTPASALSFTIEVFNQDASLYTADENNAGAYLTGTAAIKRAIARAMTEARVLNIDVIDPTQITYNKPHGGTKAAQGNGFRIIPLTVGALTGSLSTAEATITVAANTSLHLS